MLASGAGLKGGAPTRSEPRREPSGQGEVSFGIQEMPPRVVNITQ